MRAPTDAQARLLALVQDRLPAIVEWNRRPEYKSTYADLTTEEIDRDNDTVRFRPLNTSRPGIRIVTVQASVRAGWLEAIHDREVTFPATDWQPQPRTWLLTQLDLTEDGMIALGVWRERKLKAPPVELPVMSEREREIVELAQRAYELGYGLCAREPARGEASRMRRAGWFKRHGAWVANNASALLPTPIALVEIRPQEADAA